MKKEFIYKISIIICVLITSSALSFVFFNKEYNSKELQVNDPISENTNKQEEYENLKKDNVKEDTTNKDIVKKIVAIDAGHQLHGNNEQEPIGPGSEGTKAKVSSGTEGRFTKIPEYEINLEVVLKLQNELENRGYKVIMIRNTNDVNISNAERADIANKNNADILVRIHCNGSDDSNQKGALTMCPSQSNPYVGSLYLKSRKLSEDILSSLCNETGAKKCDIIEADNMSGINWSKVPVTIVEMGFMTNKEEDYLLKNLDYQKKLVTGIANGIDSYFNL